MLRGVWFIDVKLRLSRNPSHLIKIENNKKYYGIAV
jgi:hypothetical protein